ncbi:type I secretion C-terminal target domain-containing protein, partial [Burkholderiaceae bacterium]|nr:type I secretion C-terminal target domain-containing protein [Burkholderiaceae bacterium]
GNGSDGDLKVFLNENGVISNTNRASTYGVEQGDLALSYTAGITFDAFDYNGDRSLDLYLSSNTGFLEIKKNFTEVAENTFLAVNVLGVNGVEDSRQSVVELYDAATGLLVRVGTETQVFGKFSTEVSDHLVRFYGLDPAKTYDVVVKYLGGEGNGVTVVTGKTGLGTSKIAGAFTEIVDTTLTAVTPGGKDVLHVSPENVTTATTGGTYTGSQYADWFVGDKGDDVFTPNGARIGEVGDTINVSNGGSDTVIFQQLANLNTGATILGADLTAAVGAGNQGDVVDISGLLTAIGFLGTRDAAGIAAVVQVVADGTGVKIRVNKPSVGFQDLVTIHGATGVDLSAKTLSQLVSSGHLRLGGFSVNGTSTISTTETALQANAVSPFGSVTLAAQGASYANGFTGGYLLASFDKTYANDVWSVAGTGISVNGSAVTVGGNVVATIDSTSNGMGTALKLTLDFSGTSLSAADQAGVVQTLAQGITYGNAGSTPTDYARTVTIEVSDGASSAKDASLLTVTPVANSATIGGVSYVTGTDAAETLAGTAADDTFVDYGGPLANAGSANATGDTLTGGGGHGTYVYRAGNVGKDTIADFTLGAAATANTDKLNLADLLEGYSAANIADFVKLTAIGSTGVSVQIDFNGKADGTSFDSYMQVDLTGVTLASAGTAYGATPADMDALRAAMITSGQLILA